MRVDLLYRLLDQELHVVRASPGACRPGVEVTRSAGTILVRFDVGGRRGVFALDCSAFDADPPSVAMVDSETLEPLSIERWAPGVPHSIHPVTGEPFVCLQGVAEYHTHPSHLDDHWDRYRAIYRLPQTVSRLLEKAGVPR